MTNFLRQNMALRKILLDENFLPGNKLFSPKKICLWNKLARSSNFELTKKACQTKDLSKQKKNHFSQHKNEKSLKVSPSQPKKLILNTHTYTKNNSSKKN